METWANATPSVVGIPINLSAGTALPALSGGKRITVNVAVALQGSLAHLQNRSSSAR